MKLDDSSAAAEFAARLDRIADQLTRIADQMESLVGLTALRD